MLLQRYNGVVWISPQAQLEEQQYLMLSLCFAIEQKNTTLCIYIQQNSKLILEVFFFLLLWRS